MAKKSKIALAAEAGEEENNENQEQPAGEVVTEPQEPVEEPITPGEETTGEAPDLPANTPGDTQEPTPEEPVTEPPAEPAPEAPAEPEKKDDGRFNETFVSTGSGYIVNVIRRKRRELGK